MSIREVLERLVDKCAVCEGGDCLNCGQKEINLDQAESDILAQLPGEEEIQSIIEMECGGREPFITEEQAKNLAQAIAKRIKKGGEMKPPSVKEIREAVECWDKDKDSFCRSDTEILIDLAKAYLAGELIPAIADEGWPEAPDEPTKQFPTRKEMTKIGYAHGARNMNILCKAHVAANYVHKDKLLTEDEARCLITEYTGFDSVKDRLAKDIIAKQAEKIGGGA